LKKFYRIFFKKLSVIIFSGLTKFLNLFNLKIIPSFSESKNYNLEYSQKTRRIILKPNIKKFSKLIIDTSHFNSQLCQIGASYGTNKSPLNVNGHRSGYTPYYELLFRHLKNEKINFAEIGIENNASTKMWRKYFSKAKIYGFEYDEKKLKKAKKHNLRNTFYKKIDVTKEANIKKSFIKNKRKFDIIIDDSTHIFEHQINVIRNVHPFIKNKGILIIEDIYKNLIKYSEQEYFEKLKNLRKFFEEIYFVEFYNLNNYTASWKNEKLLVLIKK